MNRADVREFRVWHMMSYLGALLLCMALGQCLGMAQRPVGAIAAKGQVPQSIGMVDPSAQTYGSSLPIAPGDLVRVDVFGSPDLSGRYRVSQTGEVDLILAGRLHIAGLTSEAAATELEQLLRNKDILKNPHVNVFVQEYLSHGVTILGEVKNPGMYPSLGEHRLYDLIASAGGFTSSASNRITILRADKPNPPEVLELSNMAMTDGASDVPLSAGDRVVVGTGGIVYVIGDVGRTGGFVLSRTDPELTVLKALSLAGGFNHTAKTSAATILTQTTNGLTHKDFNLNKIIQHKEPDLELHAGDVLYIPASTAKIVGYRSIEAAFAAATQATVFVLGRY